MKVGWLMDAGNGDGTKGGAELTMAEFENAAPAGVQIVHCPAGEVVEDLDAYVIGNCVSYSVQDLWPTLDKRAYKYWHDVGPHLAPTVADELYRHTIPIFCSPLQAKHMGFPDATCIPPALNLDPFRKAAENAGERCGSVSVGAWMNWGKAPERAREVAPDVEFFGSGPCAPLGSVAVDYEALPELLARYRTFIHLPSVLEPFGRAVVEAHAAGCQIITNRLVGARYWIEQARDKLDTAADDFWREVLA